MNSDLVVDRELLSTLKGDCYAVVVYAELCAKRQQYIDSKRLGPNDDLDYQITDFDINTNINDYFQRKSIAKLTEVGLIKSYLKGAPPNRYFKFINSEAWKW